MSLQPRLSWAGQNRRELIHISDRTARSAMGKGGGYVLNSVHCIEPEVPPENIVAMFDVGLAHSYGTSRP